MIRDHIKLDDLAEDIKAFQHLKGASIECVNVSSWESYQIFVDIIFKPILCLFGLFLVALSIFFRQEINAYFSFEYMFYPALLFVLYINFTVYERVIYLSTLNANQVRARLDELKPENEPKY